MLSADDWAAAHGTRSAAEAPSPACARQRVPPALHVAAAQARSSQATGTEPNTKATTAYRKNATHRHKHGSRGTTEPQTPQALLRRTRTARTDDLPCVLTKAQAPLAAARRGTAGPRSPGTQRQSDTHHAPPKVPRPPAVSGPRHARARPRPRSLSSASARNPGTPVPSQLQGPARKPEKLGSRSSRVHTGPLSRAAPRREGLQPGNPGVEHAHVGTWAAPRAPSKPSSSPFSGSPPRRAAWARPGVALPHSPDPPHGSLSGSCHSTNLWQCPGRASNWDPCGSGQDRGRGTRPSPRAAPAAGRPLQLHVTPFRTLSCEHLPLESSTS